MAINSLQQITDAWGNWMNGQYNGGGIWYTASTNYGSQSSLSQYTAYQTNVTSSSLTYGTPQSLPTGLQASAVTKNVNGTSVTQTPTYSQSQTTEQSFTWSTTQELSVGVTVSVTAGVPDTAQLSTSVTASVSLSSTTGGTYSNSQTWSIDTPVSVPPNSTVYTSLVVTTATYNVPWTGYSQLQGNVAIWFNNKVQLSGGNGDHWLWFVDIGSVFNDCINNNIIDTTGYTINALGVLAESTGTFTGGQGISSSISFSPDPTGGTSAAATADAKAPVRYARIVKGKLAVAGVETAAADTFATAK